MSGADDTVRLRPKARGRRPLLIVGACVVLLVAGGTAGYVLAPASAPPAQDTSGVRSASMAQPAIAPSPPVEATPAVAPAALAPPAFAPPAVVPALVAPSVVPPVTRGLESPAPMARPALPALATEAQILASAPPVAEVRRFALQPDIVVVQFPSLADQARALNRVAALVERAGFPRDRVLDDADLARGIRESGNQPDTLYYGHDYRAADVVRFFAEADREGLTLNPQETALRRAVEGWGWGPETQGALITLVREDMANGLDRAGRATILRHELSHGLYFTSAAYAEYARRFWTTTLTEQERRRFRAFLAREGYDTSIEDLMVNEAQAYLMHTQDARFFNAAALNMTQTRLDALRVMFLTGMPPSWLRDCTSVPGAALP